MGFRSRRRHRGHHQGGGGHHGGFGGGEPNGLQPGDDVGNRKNFKMAIVPPDDIGNRKDPEEAEWIPDEDVGNRIDIAPTHEISGVLLDLDPKRRRRRPKGAAPIERVGRYLVGGVNPIIAGGNGRPPVPVEEQEETPEASLDRSLDRSHERTGRERGDRDGRDGRDSRRRRFEQVDGVQAQEVNERRAQRFFDFEEDDRFEYTLKTPAEQKRQEAEAIVASITREAGREAVVVGLLIEDGDKPKILVTTEEKGPGTDPLFVMGNAALMSLNYLVNKIVNRFPEDRIRLAILPAGDERLYRESLAQHRQRHPAGAVNAPAAAHTPTILPTGVPTDLPNGPPSVPPSVPPTNAVASPPTALDTGSVTVSAGASAGVSAPPQVEAPAPSPRRTKAATARSDEGDAPADVEATEKKAVRGRKKKADAEIVSVAAEPEPARPRRSRPVPAHEAHEVPAEKAAPRSRTRRSAPAIEVVRAKRT